LEGAGINELFRALFGLQPTHGGEIHFHQQPVQLGSPRQAMRLKWGLIPPSRRAQGLCMDWSIARNTTLLVLKKLSSLLGLIKTSAVRSTTAAFMHRLNISAHSREQTVASLSGGNQQKVLLAKWLATDPQLLILNDPTRGVDVGAKREIYELCCQLATQGVAILLTSSEFEEVLGLADRVLVLHKTKPLQEFSGRAATKSQLLHAIAGGGQPLTPPTVENDNG
jgi:ABC-type sugar transport system ATPase subunit